MIPFASKASLLSVILLAFATFQTNSSAQPGSLGQDRPPVGRLENGSSFRGRISTPVDVDRFSFYANAGDGIQLRIADYNLTALTPRIAVHRPNGSFFTSSSGATVAEVFFQAPVSGTYRLFVDDGGSAGNTGAYEVFFARAPGGSELGPLINSGSIEEFVGLGDIDSYTFDASLGEGVQLRVAKTDNSVLTPEVWVYRPDGSYYTGSSGSEVAEVYFDAPDTGIYTVMVMDSSSGGYTGTGAYEIHHTLAPGASEHGMLANGGAVSQTIEVGDIDSYTFDASLGEGVQLRLVKTNNSTLTPEIWVYRPSGSYYTGSSSSDVAEVYFNAPASGTYTVLVMDSSTGGYAGTGAYDLHHTLAPGASEHGTLVNGGAVSQTIGVGDIDSYTFDASLGEGVQLRLVKTDNSTLTPEIWVYRPSGSYYTGSSASDVAEVYFNAPASGTYTVLVMDSSTGGYAGTGAYDLHHTLAPGANEHGALVNGGAVSQTIGVGDIDSYTFDASLGEGVQLRLVKTDNSTLTPEIWVYRPSGSYYTGSSALDVAEVYFNAPASGTYTVLVMDSSSGGYAGAGAYDLHHTLAPGANEHGALTNGGAVSQTIEVGDIDSYTFDASLGEGVQLRLAKTDNSTLTPEIWIYRPSGSYYAGSSASDVAEVYFNAPASGTYTVLVMDSSSGGYAGSGAYQLHHTLAPGANEHGALSSGSSALEFITVGDLDSYTFFASLGQQYEVQMLRTTASTLTPEVWIYRPSGSYLTGSSGTTAATVTFTANATGVFTIVVTDSSSSSYAGEGAYELGLTRL